MTNLKLVRNVFLATRTFGQLYVNDVLYCDTLEDKVRDFGKLGVNKVWGKTAIPYGKYRVIINDSVRFKRKMPLLLGVPYFEGIRIHSGNTEANTAGCILLGKNQNNEMLVSSKLTFAQFYKDLERWLKMGQVQIEITNK